MSAERDLGRRLRDVAVPGEDEAEERSRAVVRAAYEQRAPIRPAYRGPRLALALAGGVAALAIGLSPAGAKVGDLVEDVIGVGEEDAKPALRALPAAGELLVESEQGVWIVREDGSKRLLGDYDHATWSPRGLFVAAANGRQLVTLDPLGGVRWTITAPGRVADPRWSPSGFRIAYRSGDDLRVVAGDGTADRLVARDIAPLAPAWRPIGGSKLAPAGTGSHVLTYLERDKDMRTVNVDSGEPESAASGEGELLSTSSLDGAVSPDGRGMAFVRDTGARDELVLLRTGGSGQPRVLFPARGNLTGPTWSPDGRWLLVGWREADQWLFIRTDRPGRIAAFDRITAQFDPGGTGDGGFPRVAGWVLPRR
jgi:dipeptidyl aminopeptidase/acylaminoacyl peptidase